MKLAVLSHTLPPSPSGQSVVLGRILCGVNRADYCLITTQDHQMSAESEEGTPRLPARCYSVPLGWDGELPSAPVIRAARMLVKGAWALVERAIAVARIIRLEECRALVACTGSLLDLPAAFLASRWTHVPLCAYIFDDYVLQWTNPEQRSFARRIAPIVMRGAAGVIVPNEFLRDEYHRRYEIDPLVIHNPCEFIHGNGTLPWPAEPDEIKIVYTGAVYEAHYDAFHRLLAAIKLMEHPELRLHLYTAQPAAELEREGITGAVTYHPHVPISQVLEVQRQADILFLPLAFNSPYPELIRTSAPGKMGEYLAAGRPILAHVPGDTFVGWYLRTHEAGLVLDRVETTAFVQAMQQILVEPDTRQRWCTNALVCARTDFSLETARTRFVALLQAAESG